MELEKAQETIQAAETLVSKLDGEFKRWSGQVRNQIVLNAALSITSSTIWLMVSVRSSSCGYTREVAKRGEKRKSQKSR